MSLRWITRAWAALAALFLALEAYTIVRRETGDTFSEHLWRAIEHPALGAFAATAWAWMTWHFFVETWAFPELRRTYADDTALLLVSGALLALFLARR